MPRADNVPYAVFGWTGDAWHLLGVVHAAPRLNNRRVQRLRRRLKAATQGFRRAPVYVKEIHGAVEAPDWTPAQYQFVPDVPAVRVTRHRQKMPLPPTRFKTQERHSNAVSAAVAVWGIHSLTFGPTEPDIILRRKSNDG